MAGLDRFVVSDEIQRLHPIVVEASVDGVVTAEGFYQIVGQGTLVAFV